MTIKLWKIGVHTQAFGKILFQVPTQSRPSLVPPIQDWPLPVPSQSQKWNRNSRIWSNKQSKKKIVCLMKSTILFGIRLLRISINRPYRFERLIRIDLSSFKKARYDKSKIYRILLNFNTINLINLDHFRAIKLIQIRYIFIKFIKFIKFIE